MNASTHPKSRIVIFLDLYEISRYVVCLDPFLNNIFLHYNFLHKIPEKNSYNWYQSIGFCRNLESILDLIFDKYFLIDFMKDL